MEEVALEEVDKVVFSSTENILTISPKDKDKRLHGKVSLILGFTTFIATVCGSFQFGWNTGVMTAPGLLIQNFTKLTYEERYTSLSQVGLDWLWSTIISIYCIGGAVGAFIAAPLVDIFGRKGGIMVLNVFSICGSLMMSLSDLAENFEMLIIGRFIIGIYAGSIVTAVPLYLAEIAPKNLRGAIGTCNQLCITLGILISQLFGIYVLDDKNDWPILLSLTGVFSVIMIVFLPICPESPRWLLIKKGREAEAENVLKQLRDKSDVSAEIEDMFLEYEKESREPRVSMTSLFTNKHYLLPLTISVVVHGAQQFSGINAIFFYASELFVLLGFEDNLLNIAVVLSGAVNFVTTIVAVFIVEHTGRRPLLLWPFISMTVLMALLTVFINVAETNSSSVWKYLSLVCVYLYIVSFAVGPGPIPFVLVAEIWSQGPRPAAMGVSVLVNWTCNFIVGLTFPFLEGTIGGYTFLIYMAFSFLASIFIFFKVPETKNKTFEEIISNFNIGATDIVQKEKVIVARTGQMGL